MQARTSVPTSLRSCAFFALGLCAVGASASDWPHYGGGLDGARFASGVALSPQSVTRLEQAWVFRTGDVANGEGYFGRTSTFKATPILVGGTLIFSSGFNRVFAVDARSGEERWRFDPEVDFSVRYSEMFTSRGVAAWRDPDADASQVCATRVYLGTLDARLIAIDAATGKRCAAFGGDGEIDLSVGIDNYRRGEYSMTSPPTVVNGVVIAGSSVGDNGGVELDRGTVRGFDARSGRLRWQYDPVPRRAGAPAADTWSERARRRTGAANVWSVIAADAGRNLVFLPTSSPSPDFYGGERLGDNAFANSIVALRATTGEFVWGYQLVRHDLWDYDLAAQPLLIDVDVRGRTVPLLAQATKMGFVFTLDRATGEPVHRVEERTVPASDVPGESVASTQKFPALRLHPVDAKAPVLWEHDDEHTATCRAMLANVRYEGIFTPPSLAGTMLYPGNPGGTNWGSMAAHPQRGIGFVVVNRLPTIVKLIPRKDFDTLARVGTTNGVPAAFTEQSGTPYGMTRYELYNRDNGLPCLRGPWATLVAVDLAAARIVWESPLGHLPGSDNIPDAAEWGGFGYGGPMATAGGVVFVATRFDAHLRAFDMHDGREVWRAPLPAEPEATPMSYRIDGEDFVVIAAGGARGDGEGRGDFVIAFKATRSPAALDKKNAEGEDG